MRIVRFISLITLAFVALAACGEPRSERQGGDPPESEREQERPIVAAEGSCGEKQTTTAAVDDLRPREVLDRVAEALTCPGHVAHVLARVDGGIQERPATVEYWLDIENGVLRIHSTSETDAPEQIVNPAGEFRRYRSDDQAEKSDRSEYCSGYGEELLSYLIDIECLFYSSGPGLSVDSEEYESQQAVVLRSQRPFPYGPDEEDGIVEFDSRVYFDPHTFVPLGAVGDGTLEGHPLVNEKFAVAYEVDFVPFSSLASDFFEPSSIGYVEPIAELDEVEGSFYWLGESLPAGDGFSELRIDDAWEPGANLRPTDYIGIIYYEPDVALHEYDAANMSQEARDYFEELFLVLDECIAETIEVDLGDGRGVIWGEGREAADGTCGPATHYVGRAFFEETMVTVITSENTGAEFDSAEGMERVLRGLKRRD